MQEAEIIKLFVQDQVVRRSDVWLGIGDDAAIVIPAKDHALVTTTDTVVMGVHIPLDTPPDAIGYKSVAVNLSDLAAMGANPAHATLALTLPNADFEWLKAFSCGMYRLLTEHNVMLIGGDTTRGPLSITFQLQGYVPLNSIGTPLALTHSGAEMGDRIYVSGTLGDGAHALHQLQKGADRSSIPTLHRLDYPTPRVTLGAGLRGIASAMVDISDGLLRDLNHILTKSQVGAEIWVDRLPLSKTLQSLSDAQAIEWSLTGGDDYELCCCIPEEKAAEAEAIAIKANCAITWIGQVASADFGVRCMLPNGSIWMPKKLGYEPF